MIVGIFIYLLCFVIFEMGFLSDGVECCFLFLFWLFSHVRFPTFSLFFPLSFSFLQPFFLFSLVLLLPFCPSPALLSFLSLPLPPFLPLFLSISFCTLILHLRLCRHYTPCHIIAILYGVWILRYELLHVKLHSVADNPVWTALANTKHTVVFKP